MLIAADGLIQNQGLGISGELTLVIDDYNNTDVISSYTNVLTSAVASIGNVDLEPDPETGEVVANVISQSTFTSLQQLGDGVLPALTNAVTTEYLEQVGPVPDDYTGGLSGRMVHQAQNVMGNGDLSKFAQVLGLAQGYTFLVNQFVESAEGASKLNSTFTDMSALSSGSVTEISDNLPLLAQDLLKLGTAWDMNNLDYLGYPWLLLRQLSLAGGLLPEFIEKLIYSGINVDEMFSVVQAGESPSPRLNYQIYRALKNITGNDLQEALVLLDVTTPDLTSLGDLLDPIKALPNSYLTLRNRVFISPDQSRVERIYSQTNTINSSLASEYNNDPLYQDLKRIIPTDQALANRALSRSLLQVKNIFLTGLDRFANAVSSVETLSDLDQIDQLSTPVPESTVGNIKSILGTGSGTEGKITLFDVIGSAAGVPYVEQYQSMTDVIEQLKDKGELDVLTNETDGLYTVMFGVLNGEFDDNYSETPGEDPNIGDQGGDTPEFRVTIPTGYPAAGTYSSYDQAFTQGLIPEAGNILGNIASTNPDMANSLNTSTSAVTSAIVKELSFQSKAQINFDDLADQSESTILSMATGLHEIGTDTGESGRAVYFEKIAQTENVYGQAVIAAMREGRNIATLNNASIRVDSQVPLGNVA